MGIMFLVAAAYLADYLKKPFEVAALYTLIMTVMSFVGGDSLVEALLSGAIMLVFTMIYFSALISVSSSIFLWLVVLMGFPLVYYLASFKLLRVMGGA